MSCCSIAKCLFMLINAIILVISIAFIAIGVLLVFVSGPLFNSLLSGAQATASGYGISETNIDYIPVGHEIGVTLLVLGAFLFFVSFLGCYGSCCGSCCLCCRLFLILFAIVMLCIMISELVVITMFLVPDSALHGSIKSNLKDRITLEYTNRGSDSFSELIDTVNYYFSCCGVDGVGDFVLPPTSCQTNVKGCYVYLTDAIQDNVLYAGIAFAILLFLQLVEVILAIVIFKQSKSKVSPF